MLYIKNASYFRKYYKEKRAGLTDPKIKIDFIDISHPKAERTERGFAGLVMGFGRKSIKDFLRSTVLNIAADQQSIYELIQNADDCDSSFINIAYNEHYLLCINNGKNFSYENMSSVINIGDSDKTEEEIGSFGIGFKIVHRLLGEDDGADAIINDYAGAIVFSWNQFFQFEQFINNDEISVNRIEEKNEEKPWLVKLIYTCFPTHIEEPIRLSDYESKKTVFDKNELAEFRNYLTSELNKINITKDDFLKTGSIFFIKLGKGKSKFIEDNIDKLKSGIAYSFNFLQSLKKIYINGESILAKRLNTFKLSYKIGSAEFNSIAPRNKKRDIEATFGYVNTFNNPINNDVPNFYTFFSMDDEKNNLGFIIHCNAFDMHNDRRKLQPDSQINLRLFPFLMRDILGFMEEQKGKHLFTKLYATFLISSEPSNKPQILEGVYQPIKKYLLSNIPTQNNSYSNNPENIKVKNIKININTEDIGCPEIEWFFWWENEDSKEVIKESLKPEKLGLEKWDIIELFKYAIEKEKIDKVNEWVKKTENESSQIKEKESYKPYLALLNEINKNCISKASFSIVSHIKLYKFNNGEFYSLNEIFENDSLILNYDKSNSIKLILRNKLGFVLSLIDISKANNIYNHIKDRFDNAILFQKISDRLKVKRLRYNDVTELIIAKRTLFLALIELSDNDTKKLRDLELFSNTKGEVKQLRKLIKGDLNVPKWLLQFKVINTDYNAVPELATYCVKEEEIYRNVICEDWFTIVQLVGLNQSEFYEQVSSYYQSNKENIPLTNFELPTIAVNKEFKKADEVFFNSYLSKSTHYHALQTAILKITGKPTPNKHIVKFLSDAKSPFIISKNETIKDSIIDSITLEYEETVALLELARNNNEKLFDIVFIQKQGKVYLITKHTQNVFHYYSERNEINDLLVNNSVFKLFPKDLIPAEWVSLGIIQDKLLLIKIIKNVEFSANLLPIIKESDKEVQLAYLSSIKTLNLQVGKSYDKNSFEHRCLKLALDCYETSFKTDFAPKIVINENLKIRDIAVKDDINFDDITLSLAKVLPKYKGKSDIISTIINQFTDITRTELRDKVFPIDNKPKEEILSELQNEVKVLNSIDQFAFLLLFSHKNNKSFFTNELVSTLPTIDILQYCFSINFVSINKYIELEIEDKVYPSEIALKFEELPSWVLSWMDTSDKELKLNFLASLGVHTETSILVLLRKYFKKETILDVESKILSFPQNSVLLSNTLIWLENFTFSSSDNLILENLKQLYNRIDYAQTIPLLFVEKIAKNETTFVLEISKEKKYFFENPIPELEDKILQILKNKGFKLLALGFFKKWLNNISPIKIETTNQLNIDKLKDINICSEWFDPAYEKWKIHQKYRVFIYRGELLPHTTSFLNEVINNYNDKKSILLGNIIYVSENSEFIEIVKCLGEFISPEDCNKLYEIKFSKSESESTENTKENNKAEYTDEEIDYLKSIIMGEIDYNKPDQFSANQNAFFRAILYLKDNGFNIDKGEATNDYFNVNEKTFINLETGNPHKFMIRSAVKGVLFLDPSSWNKLDKIKTALLIYLGKNNIIEISSKEELINKYKSINRFGLVRIEDTNSPNVYDNLLFARDDDFDSYKLKNYKLLFLVKDNDYTKGIYESIFKDMGGDNDSY